MRDGDTGTGTEVRINVAECGKCTANQKMMLAYKHINILSVGTRPVGYSHSGISEHTVCCAGGEGAGVKGRGGADGPQARGWPQHSKHMHSSTS